MKNILLPLGLILALLSLGLNAAHTQSTTTSSKATQVDQYIDQVMSQYNIPGVALAIVKDDKVVHRKNYGFANLEHEVPVTDKSIFRVYSLTKPIVTVGLFQLVEQGKLSVEDKITDHLEGLPESWNHLQIKHLLTHSSGLVDMAPFYEFREFTEEQAQERIYAQDLKFEAGEKFDYNQTNFWLIKRVIEKLSNKSLSDFILEGQFDKDTKSVFFSNDSRDIVKHRATAYFPFSKGEMTIDHPYMQGNYGFAMNGLNITLDEFIKWDQRLQKNQLIKEATKDLMWQSFEYKASDHSFAYSWDKRILNDHISYGFSGSMVTAYRTFPDDNISVFVLGNGMGKWFDIEFIVNDLAKLYNPDIIDIDRMVFDQLLASAETNSFADFKASFDEMRMKYKDENVAFENHINRIGYHFLRNSQASKAIKIFKLNNEEFPKSWNTYDSLAEAYEVRREIDQALIYYQKALELTEEKEPDQHTRIKNKIAELRK